MISKIYKQVSLVFFGALTGLVGIMLLYGFSYAQKIYPFIFVGQDNLSNLNIKEAEEVLKQKLPKDFQVMEIGFGNQSFVVELNELEYKPKLTAEKAYLLGREKDFFGNLKTRWRLWFEKKVLGFEYEVDKKSVESQVDLLISQITEPPIYYGLGLTPDGRVIIQPGKSGRVVNKEKLMRDIYHEVSRLSFKVSSDVSLVEVMVSPDKLSLTQKRGEVLKDKTMVLKYADKEKKVSGQSLIELIGFEGEFSETKVMNLLELVSEEVDREPQSAVFRFEGGRVVEFKPALEGLKVNKDKSLGDVIVGLKHLEELGCDKRMSEEECSSVVVEIAVETFDPEVSIDEVNSLGIKELIGVGESSFHHSIPSRKHNVALTAHKLNGVLVKPGEVFSFNESVGDISAATGYQAAYVIKDGRTVLGDGGGVCQDSTTMFRAALDAGLPIVERHPHAYRVSYYEQNSPVGIDATIYSPSTDFKFLNDTPAHVLIQTSVDTVANYLKIEIYGTSDGREANISNARMWGQTPPPEPKYEDTPSLAPGVIQQIDWAAWGAKAAFDWKVIRGDEVLQEKTFYSNYRPWQAVYLRGI